MRETVRKSTLSGFSHVVRSDLEYPLGANRHATENIPHQCQRAKRRPRRMPTKKQLLELVLEDAGPTILL